MDLQCDICFISFDTEKYRPKSLPCGHTICKECVENPSLGGKCPTCRKDLGIDPSGLPDNIILTRMLYKALEPPCKMARRESVAVRQLQRGVGAGRKLVQQLQQVVPATVEKLSRLLDSSVAQLRQLEEALEKLEQEAGNAVDPNLIQVQLQLEESLRLLTFYNCSVFAEEEGGAAWRASEHLGATDQTLGLLLLQLRTGGQLKKADGGNHAAPNAPFVGPPGTSVLTIGKEDLDGGNLKVDEIVRDVQRWKWGRCLKDVRGANTEKLLRVMAPQLEELQFRLNAEVRPCVMEEVQAMKALRRLKVYCKKNEDEEGYPDLPLQLEELEIWEPSENQLRCVQRMPRLRSLEVNNYLGPEVLFPPAQHGGLLWLSVALWRAHQTTMLSLIRAHAASLQELRITCEAEPDNVPGVWYFPDLGELLAASGLVSLRRLVLRRSKHKCTATHACLLQRWAIRDLLPHSVDVSCFTCEVPVA